MSVIAEFGDQMRDSIDEAWAEAVRLSPMSDHANDDGRDQVTIQAVLRTGEQERVRFAQGRGASARVTAANAPASTGTLKIDRAHYPDIDVRVGDKVRAMDRVGKPVFEVSSVDPISHHRLVVSLNSASS